MLSYLNFGGISNSISIRGLHLRSLYSCFPFIFVALGSSYFIIRNSQFKRAVISLFRQIHYDRCSPKLINNVDECEAAVTELRKSCCYVRVLGMDCEWLSDGKSTTKVALLQLASIDGSCSLFRLCSIGHIPQSLSELLMDKSVLKTGVAVTSDARKLLKDYGVNCNGCVDVRYMAKHVGLTALGLAKMSELYLGIELDKNWRIRCSDWEADVLTDKQLQYAAKDALMSVYLFKYFNDIYMNKTYPWWKRLFWSNRYYWQKTNECWNIYSDLGFSEKSFSWHQQKGSKDGSGSCTINDFDSLRKRVSSTQSKDNFRQFSTRTDIARKSPFYHNIFVQAPDGMVLCTCDNKKVDWYLKKGIAHVVCEDPLTIRLNFEPAGRKGGGEGYYAKVKKNICVVCGSTKSMRRKNIVPHEYRKYFPVELKEHSSHDVLLLCDYCHFKSQYFDQQLRSMLAEQCNAPYGTEGNNKVVEFPEMKQMKSAARALLYNKEKIPESRKNELELLLCNYIKDNKICEYLSKYIPPDDINDFKTNEILNNGLLEKLSEVETSIENENYQPHGLKVVEYYNKQFTGGVHYLEQLWRKHFIKNMVPQYLPDLWSIDYIHATQNSSDQ